MLEIKDYSFNYGPVPAISEISVRVQEGEMVALIGANGAGKTTILRSVSGLIRGRGKISFLGKGIENLKPHEIVTLGISHVPERRGIFSNLTVRENLVMGAYTKRLKESDFQGVFDLFPRLREREGQLAGTLSGGEQQMLAVSRALLSQPKLMLLDEPSLGLAPQVCKFIFEILKKINQQGTTILLVEQNAFAALKISHRAYVLEVGRVILENSSDKLLADETIRKAYLGEVV